MAIHKTQSASGSDQIQNVPLTDIKCITATTLVALLALGAVIIGTMAIHASLHGGLGAMSQLGWKLGVALTVLGCTALVITAVIHVILHCRATKPEEINKKEASSSPSHSSEQLSEHSHKDDELEVRRKADELKAQQEEQRKADELKTQQEEQRKADELKAQQEAQRKTDELKAQQEEQRKADELKTQQEEQRKADELKAQQEVQRKADELKAQQEAQKQADTLKAQQEEQRKADELKAQQAAQTLKEPIKIVPDEIVCLSPYAAKASFDAATTSLTSFDQARAKTEEWIRNIKQLPQYKDVCFERITAAKGRVNVVFRMNTKNGKACPPITDVLKQAQLAYKPNELNPSKIVWATHHTAKVSFSKSNEARQWQRQIGQIPPFDMLCFERDYDNQGLGMILRVLSEHQNQGIKITDVLRDAGFPCEGVPKRYSIKQLLDDLSQEYKINGHRYKIEKLLSDHGCYGDVFLAVDIDSKEKVAIKVLRLDEDKEASEMKKMHQRGGHPNIVRYIGDGRLMDKTWIVMEYITGETMGQLQKRGDWNQDLDAQLKAGEQFMSQSGVKTERENNRDNVLVTEIDGKKVVKLIDFGTLARS